MKIIIFTEVPEIHEVTPGECWPEPNDYPIGTYARYSGENEILWTKGIIYGSGKDTLWETIPECDVPKELLLQVLLLT